MSVYVDPMQPVIPNRNWRSASACHMFADTVTELHEMAQAIGLRRSWFQHRAGRLPHYDLTTSKRREAVAMGAVQMTRREAVMYWKMRRWITGRPGRPEGSASLPRTRVSPGRPH
jgi:hypothetical protein